MTTVSHRSFRVVMIGAFPPPVHGMSVVNSAVLKHLRKSGDDPRVINLAAPGLGRSLSARLKRLPLVLRGLLALARMRGVRGKCLYMSVSGGSGQCYELAFLLLAKSFRMRIILHHHSYAYLSKARWITRWLIMLAGNSAVHVTQCLNMVQRLHVLYGVMRAIPVSNSVFLGSDLVPEGRAAKSVSTIGFISNIAAEKGVFDFLSLMEAIEYLKLPLKGVLAGPFQDSSTKEAVSKRLALIGNVKYLGARYGKNKDVFYNSIDVLIFPTRYQNETESIVNQEALSHGVPIIAYGRGCIPEIIGPKAGLIVDPGQPFVPAAVAQLEAWIADPGSFRIASQAAAQGFTDRNSISHERWEELSSVLLGHDSGLPSLAPEEGKRTKS